MPPLSPHFDPKDERPVVTARPVRLVVPLFDTAADLIRGRVQLAPTIYLAGLDEAEATRVQEALLEPWLPTCRLELHDVPLGYSDDGMPVRETRIADEVERVLGLLCCAVRMAPRWPTIVADEYGGSHWTRVLWIPRGGGFQHRHSYLPAERIETWSALLSNWPAERFSARANLALRFFYASITDTGLHIDTAFASAATSLEILLGGKQRDSIRRRLSERGALLVARGPGDSSVARRLRSLYDERSALTHAGRCPDGESLVRLQQYLMRAIPSMAQLTETCGSHDNAVATLDSSAEERSTELEGLFTPEQWWSSVDVPEAWSRPA